MNLIKGVTFQTNLNHFPFKEDSFIAIAAHGRSLGDRIGLEIDEYLQRLK
jgi:hypothetical protein